MPYTLYSTSIIYVCVQQEPQQIFRCDVALPVDIRHNLTSLLRQLSHYSRI